MQIRTCCIQQRTRSKWKVTKWKSTSIRNINIVLISSIFWLIILGLCWLHLRTSMKELSKLPRLMAIKSKYWTNTIFIISLSLHFFGRIHWQSVLMPVVRCPFGYIPSLSRILIDAKLFNIEKFITNKLGILEPMQISAWIISTILAHLPNNA